MKRGSRKRNPLSALLAHKIVTNLPLSSDEIMPTFLFLLAYATALVCWAVFVSVSATFQICQGIILYLFKKFGIII